LIFKEEVLMIFLHSDYFHRSNFNWTVCFIS